MKKITLRAAKKIVPMCYAYTTPQIREHDGWTKIGYTEQKVEDRIDQQTKTANVQWVLGWKGMAVYDDGSGEAFGDRDFHTYLQKNGVERKAGTEWFRIEPEPSRKMFIDFKQNRGVLTARRAAAYTLRKEQADAVAQTKAYFDSHADGGDAPEFLWNAKPRFGKTLATYDLCKALNAKKVLIVTNRPAIANSWYDDYVKFMGAESGYCFISDVSALQGKPYVVARENLPSDAKGFIEFVSLQDLKGSIHFGGKFDKLEHIVELTWDLLVIDEAHEGVDTYKTDVAFDNIDRKHTLHLSGTPFKALANEKFEEAAIFNWTYADEQTAKRDWDGDGENPYANLPFLNLYTYQMSEIVRDKAEQGADFNDDGENENFAFDLNEFFAVEKGRFKYDDAVDKFLDALTTQEKFPFSTEELRGELKHTFWLLNRVDSAKVLAEKLKAHPVFGDYEIVLAAGDGKLSEDEETKKSFDKVVEAIKNHDRTITLSVGQLTTGVTIPEWTAVLMLSNVKSPALYMQAAFRAQNPCLFNFGGQFYRKENAYVFDFDPARTLDIFEQFANDLSADTASGNGDTDARKRHVRELLNFFPVYGEDDDGEMIALDAEKVLSIPRKIHAKEVVRRGFMSNFLFQNIGNIFSAPKAVVDIIRHFEPVKEPVSVTDKTKDDLSLNENGEIELPPALTIGRATEIFGDKIYGDVADDLTAAVENFKAQTPKTEDAALEKLKDVFKSDVEKQLISAAKENYGKDMAKSTQNNVVRKITAETNKIIDRQYGNYKIEQSKIELERKKALSAAPAAKRMEINTDFDQKQRENKAALVASLQDKVPEIVEKAGQTVVAAVETDKRRQEKDKIEDSVRDHLRGFSRTIPSFLMAYGDENTTLETFDKIIPDNVFKEVTSISLDEFRFLRDGGDYIDEEPGEKRHFDGHLFDVVVFDDAVKEFLALKQKLANYFDDTNTEDIFDYIPPQKNNQIFTPKQVVREMVDALETENAGCFDNPDHTFIDLYMKSGLYITEIVKRLYNSPKMAAVYPDRNDRLNHIFAKQVFGLAPTEIIYRIATAYILGFDENAAISRHNFRKYDALPAARNGTLEQELDKVFGK